MIHAWPFEHDFLDWDMLLFWTLICGSLIILWARFLTDEWASPLGVFAFAWTALIVFYELDLVSYDPVRESTLYALFLNVANFILGGLTALTALARSPSLAKAPPFTVDPTRLERAMFVLLPLSIFGFLLQLQHLETTVGLSNFWDNPPLARSLHTNIKYWGYFNILNVANATLCVIHLCLFRRPRWWQILLLLVALTSALLTTDRTRIFYMAIWVFFAGLYATGGLRATRGKALALVLTIAGLLLFFVLVGKHYQRSYYDRFREHIRISEPFSFLAEPYIYMTGSIPALDALMRDQTPTYGGQFSFSPVITVLGPFVPGLEPIELQGKLYFLPMELNTYSYLQQFYLDFGWFGILLGPYVCGFLACWIYGLMRRRPTLFRVYAASLLAYCCVISIFVNMFTQEATWFFLAVGWFVHLYVQGLTPSLPIKMKGMQPDGGRFE